MHCLFVTHQMRFPLEGLYEKMGKLIDILDRLIPNPCAYLIAVITTVRPLLRVRWQVTLQRFCGTETFSTQRALALGHIHMGIAVVFLECRICKVGGTAQIAYIRPFHLRMQLDMPL